MTKEAFRKQPGRRAARPGTDRFIVPTTEIPRHGAKRTGDNLRALLRQKSDSLFEGAADETDPRREPGLLISAFAPSSVNPVLPGKMVR